MSEVYKPPQSELNFKSREVNDIIDDLAHQGTLRLLILSVVTLGVYTAFYIKRQTVVINNYTDESAKISGFYINLLLVLAVFLVPLFFVYLFLEDSEVTKYLDYFSYTIDYLYIFLTMVWAIKARNRLNNLLNLGNNEKNWFNGFWALIFQELYVNYKVNSIKEYQDSPEL